LAPHGKIGVIDDPAQLDVTPLKPKAASLHWGFMFTRSMLETPTMIERHHLVNTVAQL
jgi:hypothetical protein